MTKKTIQLSLVPLIMVGLFISLSIPFLQRGASQDDFWNFESAKRLPETKIPLFYRGTAPHLEHPPLYLHLLDFFLRSFGRTLRAGRCVGILTASLTLFFLFYFCHRFFREEKSRFFPSIFSCLLLATSPVMIQGAQILDIDGTLLALSFSLMIFGWVLFGDSSTAGRDFGLGALFTLALWSKLVTPLFLPLGISAALLFSKRTGEFWRLLRPFFFGFLIFAGTWWFYCLKQEVLSSFWDPVSYHAGAFEVWHQKRSTALSLPGILGALLRTGGWFSWPSLLLFGIGAVGLWRDRRKNFLGMRDALIAVFFVFLGFLFMKGLSFSFPKYDVPLLPFFCAVSAWPMRSVSLRDKSLFLFLVCVGIFSLFQYHVVGDLLYLLLFDLRIALLEGRGGDVAVQLFQKNILTLFVFLLAWGGIHSLERKRLQQTFCFTLAAMAIATNISQTALQIKAPYGTGNLYGDSHREEVLTLLKRVMRPGDTLIAHDLIHFGLGSFTSPFVPANQWGDPKAILNLVEKERARALVYSLSIHTLSQYRNTFLDQDFQKQLRRSFERYDLGTYTVWIRKEKGGEK